MRQKWTTRQLTVLRRMYPDHATKEIAKATGRSVASVYQRANHEGLRKSAQFMQSQASGRLMPGDSRGKNGRFKKGLTPWNKGTHYVAGGRSAETRFKPGHKPQTEVPVGTEVVDRDGYRKRKIRDDAKPGMSRFNWAFVHRLLWEQHHGPIPKKHAVMFRNGDKTDIRIENLELISMARNMQRNSIHNLPKELATVIQLKGAVQRQINKRNNRREKQNRGSAQSPVRDVGAAKGQG